MRYTHAHTEINRRKEEVEEERERVFPSARAPTYLLVPSRSVYNSWGWAGAAVRGQEHNADHP